MKENLQTMNDDKPLSCCCKVLKHYVGVAVKLRKLSNKLYTVIKHLVVVVKLRKRWQKL
jgi:hypothetical protein